MVNQVGSPAMFEGNRFLPLTGMPIWKMARSSTLLAVWLPEPLTVATWMLKSLTMDFMVCRTVRGAVRGVKYQFHSAAARTARETPVGPPAAMAYRPRP